MTDGIDRVLISAPDAPWSRGVITALVNEFRKQRKSASFQLEVAFYMNDRYDAGLWCDGLTQHFGFDGKHFVGKVSADNSISPNNSTSVFLINDSVVSLFKYDSLMKKVLTNARIEQKYQMKSSRNKSNQLKLVSLNGVLPNKRGKGWVESVYRGLTPEGVSKFHQHSCVNMGAWCRNLKGNVRKKCIVDRYEKSLTDVFLSHEVDAMVSQK